MQPAQFFLLRPLDGGPPFFMTPSDSDFLPKAALLPRTISTETSARLPTLGMLSPWQSHISRCMSGGQAQNSAAPSLVFPHDLLQLSLVSTEWPLWSWLLSGLRRPPPCVPAGSQPRPHPQPSLPLHPGPQELAVLSSVSGPQEPCRRHCLLLSQFSGLTSVPLPYPSLSGKEQGRRAVPRLPVSGFSPRQQHKGPFMLHPCPPPPLPPTTPASVPGDGAGTSWHGSGLRTTCTLLA